MTVYVCEHEWEAMLTAIYDAWSSGLGHKNVQLTNAPVEQYSFLHSYVEVVADAIKAKKVIDSIYQKLSPHFYEEISYCSMADDADVVDVIYRVMILGFAYGPGILDAIQYKDVFRLREIRKRLSNETCHFVDFMRFHEIRGNGGNGFGSTNSDGGAKVYVAHFEPKNSILPALAGHFSDRMPSEYWMIIDDVHREALVHPKDEPFYFQKLSDTEYQRLLATEEVNDSYTSLWKTFFRAIAIEQRHNEKCQRTLYPLWTRKHAVEFI